MSVTLNEKPEQAGTCQSNGQSNGHSHGQDQCQTQARPNVNITEKAAAAVQRIVSEQQQTGAVPEKIYLRIRVVGGGCSGFEHKLDLDPTINAKLDEVFEVHGVPVVIDKRSLMYLDGVKVDYHEDLNRRGFSISNPQAKSTCGCGSSFSM